MRIVLYRWVKTNWIMLTNAGSLVGTTAVTSVLGFVYWWIAARLFSPEAVGFASAAISVMLLLGTASMLGLGTMLISELQRQPGKEASLISAALAVVGVAGGCLGIVFAVVAPLLSHDFQALGASLANVALFAVGVGLTGISLVLDQAQIGLLQGSVQLWRNTLFAVAKLAAIFGAGLWVLHVVGLTIYATWVVGSAFSLVALAGFALVKGGWSGKSYLPEWGLLRKLGSASLKHHALNLTLQAPSQILPVLVTVVLSATATAWFYVSFMLANFVFIISVSLTIVLFATSSARPDTLTHNARLTVGLATVVSVLANCVLLLGTSQVLSLFGHSYAQQAAWCLRILGLGAFPLIIRNHYIAICRIEGRLTQATLRMIAAGGFELGASALGAHLGGLSGLSLGWLVAVCIEAVLMFSTVYKVVRPIRASSHTDQLPGCRPYYNGVSILDAPINDQVLANEIMLEKALPTKRERLSNTRENKEDVMTNYPEKNFRTPGYTLSEVDESIIADNSQLLSRQATYDALVLDGRLRQSVVTVRSLGRRGVRVAALETVSGLPAPAFSSRWCQHKIVCPAEEGTKKYLEYLEHALDSTGARVLITSSDGTVALVRQYRERLEQRVRIALAEEPALGIAINKEQTLEIAEQLGLGVPHAVTIKSVDEVQAGIREIGLPAVVKPVESWMHDGKRRVVSQLVTTPDEARRAVEELTRFGEKVLFQQFLPGRRESLSFFIANGKTHARFAFWGKRTNPPLGGIYVLRQAIAMPPDTGEQAERLVREIELEGYSQVEFRRDSAGKPCLMEINSRLNAGIEVAVRAGVDFPYLLYQWANGDRIDEVKSYRTDVQMRDLGGDLATTIASVRQHGRPGVTPPLRAILDFFLSFFMPMGYDYVDWKDLRPALTAIRGFPRYLLRRGQMPSRKR